MSVSEIADPILVRETNKADDDAQPARFPPDFIWGTATSAYQIEGAADEDGRGESIWDRFAAKPGAVSDGSNGKVACDHHHRYREDIALMKGLGVNAYRFSIAWPRILPTGRGTPLTAGLDHYSRLVDSLLEAGLRPFVTLNHWDLPQALEDAGGWPVRDTVSAFVAYADAVSRRLGDRVKDWTTHNEPWCMAHLGYQTGEHAPGRKEPSASLAAVHHLLLAHGRAVPVIRANAPGARVNIVLNVVPAWPASSSAIDAEATRRFDGFFNRWYLDPLFRGRYPDDAIADRVADGHLPTGPLPFVVAGDFADIQAPIDGLGLNYYSRAIIRGAEEGNAPRMVPVPTAAQQTDMGWELFPEGLTVLLERVHRDYAPKSLWVSENGAAYGTGVDAAGRVRDVERCDYVQSHIAACQEAIRRGVPLQGYFLWSLLDNFEWQFGYSKRFGIVHVDYQTQRRTLKDSAHLYSEIIARNQARSAP